ncbi:hypothetical proline hydroxylase [alpha proteobacterium U9-1i]|nr:hypothetical proline hydroxylase [alpha proteobacterium U9-1i]
MTSTRAEGEAFLAAAFDHGNVSRAREALRDHSRVHLANFLPRASALSLCEASARAPWKLLLNHGRQTFQVPFDQLAAMGPEKRDAMFGEVYRNASEHFQYLYECHHIANEYASGAVRVGALAEFYETLNSERGIAALRTLVGDQRIAYVDAIATRYRSGHFLTAHNDEVADEGRLYAYVLNLTPQWRADWGGLLMFLSDEGHIAEAYTPRLGALNIFTVPQVHAVSVVTPFAGAPRCSISGWFRSARPAARS